MDQQSSSDAEYVVKRKQTRREKFLNEMDQKMLWSRYKAQIESYHPKAGGDRQPFDLLAMLRIHFV